MKSLIAAAVLATTLFAAAPALAEARLAVNVDLSTQTMTVSREGAVLVRWPVSTARKGYVTPSGSYKPTRMHSMWYSRKYDMSPMPYSIFFSGGYAIHGTSAVSRLGRPASHGCVRLDTANAAALYAMVKDVGAENTDIVINR